MAKPTKAELDEFFEEHLPYEISMLHASYALLGTGLLGDVLNNALIESFCVHARNLIEFFKTKESCDFDPRTFTVQNFPLKKRFVDDDVLPTITSQISHLTANRTCITSKKIGPENRKHIIDRIEGEIARLKSNLTPEWHAKCKFDAYLAVNVEAARSGPTNSIIESR